MNQEIVTVAMWMIGGLLMALTLIIGWIGARIHSRLDEIGRTLGRIELDMQSELGTLDKRLALVEDHCSKCDRRRDL